MTSHIWSMIISSTLLSLSLSLVENIKILIYLQKNFLFQKKNLHSFFFYYFNMCQTAASLHLLPKTWLFIIALIWQMTFSRFIYFYFFGVRFSSVYFFEQKKKPSNIEIFHISFGYCCYLLHNPFVVVLVALLF